MSRPTLEEQALQQMLVDLVQVGVSKYDILDAPVAVDSAAPWDLPPLSTSKFYGGVSIRKLMSSNVCKARGSTQIAFFKSFLKELGTRTEQNWYKEIGSYLSFLCDVFRHERFLSIFSRNSEEALAAGGVQAAYTLVAETLSCMISKAPDLALMVDSSNLYLVDYRGEKHGIVDLRLSQGGSFPPCPVSIETIWGAPRPIRTGFPDIFDQIRWCSLAYSNEFDDYEAFCEALSVLKYRMNLPDVLKIFDREYPARANMPRVKSTPMFETKRQMLQRHIDAIDNFQLLEFLFMRLWPDLKTLGITSEQFKKEFGNQYRKQIIPKPAKLAAVRAKLVELQQNLED